MRAEAGSTGRSRGSWSARVGLVLFGLVLGAALVEAGLQVASLVVRSMNQRRLPATWAAERIRILALGDSNTFGLHLKAEDAYPQQLETLWNETVESPKIEVVNLGYPGTSSTQLIRDLDRISSALTPDVILLMIGVNDFWADPIADEGDERPPFWRRHSKLYRLFLLMTRGEVSHRMRVAGEEFEVGFRNRGRGRGPQSVERDLLTLIDRIRARGIALHVMTYPARTRLYKFANPVIRKAATRSEAPLVDLATLFGPRCPHGDCPDLLFEDNHPTRAGCRLIAEALVAHLETSLKGDAGRP